eukprot:GILI01039172.1.p1 GENE.GILI01039172.1~~GILI01039172.1.p1  ORF type:complete len:208 (+),score=6.43 GILI01039172.1:54-626(+)
MCVPRREPSKGGGPAPVIATPSKPYPWVCVGFNVVLCIVASSSSYLAVAEDCILPLDLYLYVTSGLAGVNALSFIKFARTNLATDQEWGWNIIVLCISVVAQLGWMCLGCFYAFGPFSGALTDDCVRVAPSLYWTTFTIVIYYIILIGVEVALIIFFSTKIFVNPESESALKLKTISLDFKLNATDDNAT